MTKQEVDAILANKSHPMYKSLHKKFYENYNKCRKHYDDLGYKGYTLHHKNVCCTNYEEWKIDEIVPMTRSEHSRLHMVMYKQGLASESSIKKAHETLKRKYGSGELVPWNKGLTKETDSRIPDSPRKGKTGKDFPFLCASKKGKSGGWNKDITTDDPRYSSLKHSDGQNKKASEHMKKNNPMFNEEIRKKQKVAVNNPDVIQRRVEKLKGRKRYTNGSEVHMYKPGEEPLGYVLVSEFKNRKGK